MGAQGRACLRTSQRKVRGGLEPSNETGGKVGGPDSDNREERVRLSGLR